MPGIQCMQFMHFSHGIIHMKHRQQSKRHRHTKQFGKGMQKTLEAYKMPNGTADSKDRNCLMQH